MSGDNPYQTPETPGSPDPRGSTSAGRVVVAVILGILTLPASAVAFFGSCLAVLDAGGDETALLVGAVFGLLVMCGMIFAVVFVAAGARRK